MRAALLFLMLALGLFVLCWQVPSLVPQPLKPVAATVLGELGAPAAASAPVWPDALEVHPHKLFAQGWRWLAAGLALAALAGAGLWRVARRRAQPAKDAPAWLAGARMLARAASDGRERLQHCDLIEKRLLPDLRRKGEAALARAHQLDLYWRFLSRSGIAGDKPVANAAADRLRNATRQTLDAIAIAPGATARDAYRDVQSGLWVLDQGDARAVSAFYRNLETAALAHGKACNAARAAADKKPLDQSALLAAMEELRQINRATAKESAALVGDLSIRVRALS